MTTSGPLSKSLKKSPGNSHSSWKLFSNDSAINLSSRQCRTSDHVNVYILFLCQVKPTKSFERHGSSLKHYTSPLCILVSKMRETLLRVFCILSPQGFLQSDYDFTTTLSVLFSLIIKTFKRLTWKGFEIRIWNSRYSISMIKFWKILSDYKVLYHTLRS